MKKLTNALAAIMLVTTVFFAAECMNAQTYNGHEYVDLGLPSGTLWATCNVGATTPEGFGDYFAWGETAPKSSYSWSNNKYCIGDCNNLTKYCFWSATGHNGFTDNLTTLQDGDDAATANWGKGWCTPTKEQWEELYQNTTKTWTSKKGVDGMLFTAKNGNVLFLPAAGHAWNEKYLVVGDEGCYWTSTLDSDDPIDAWYFDFDSEEYDIYSWGRDFGSTVRPVRSQK